MKFYYVDKAKNFTSFDVVKILKGKLKNRRIGHTGTLDPLATGGLLIAVGNYTKLIPYLENDTKEYEFEISFDGKSPSYDLETEISYISEKEKLEAKKYITLDLIKKILKEKFSGDIVQIPPKYSAIKIGGMKAMLKTLKGEDFEMEERKCRVYDIELLSLEYPIGKFRALVSAGTYIRSIANDLGEELGTGGYIISLRRTKVGNLDIKDSVTLEHFDESKNLDIKELFDENRFITLDNDEVLRINNGMYVVGEFNYPLNTSLFVVNNGMISNVVEYDGESLKPKRRIF